MACSCTPSSESGAPPAPARKAAVSGGDSKNEPLAVPDRGQKIDRRGRLGETVVFSGMCDASGAVPLSSRTFMVADDEDNLLRVYDAERGGAPLWSRDISAELALPERKGKPPREMDIEAATRIGDIALWLTSYGRDSSGRVAKERFRLFATTAAPLKDGAKVVGFTGMALLNAIIEDVRYGGFGLLEASDRAPKAAGGLNIEGMTTRKEGGVWIGFRNPIPRGKALLVPFLNPIETIRGAAARIGDPHLLDLGGLGIRGLTSWHGRYLIAAGHFDRDLQRPSTLYEWDGSGTPQRLSWDELSEFNPEGFFTPEERSEFLLLSDDGTEMVDGVRCKRLKDASKKRFRGVWLRL